MSLGPASAVLAGPFFVSVKVNEPMVVRYRLRAVRVLLGVGLMMGGCAASYQVAAPAGAPPAVVAAASPAPAENPPPPTHAIIATEMVGGLPEGPGRETTIRVCSGCHAVELVAEKRLTHAEWFTLVQFMGDRGAMGTPAEFAEITDYLAEAFPKE
ncbi:hypothetical protein [Brevundimonas sp. SL161]|uniref:hypothetical protein n=1 Tax=Brevundimonas sp. SL161 TaxID=2804613 RepID=UPI003CE6C315